MQWKAKIIKHDVKNKIKSKQLRKVPMRFNLQSKRVLSVFCLIRHRKKNIMALEIFQSKQAYLNYVGKKFLSQHIIKDM